ncbi:MAG: hypothetical protein Q7U98_00085 [Methylicorpusculum sp.]|uniref:hypothetical protein n=1 Tax=Methylicorpusculum sp. TaxID=2713644 RepID=UPI0027287744|nr:hypothetical protein [Methylicorpusculum sp.]MDO8937537.1 hypothetical protein [Methylicorpusculum sp.]MDO9239327.1 hypothetical protein [Methylicorpusculum sp.]MDP2201352.1 hypothetical protein [Methylicorpusculum sp.]
MITQYKLEIYKRYNGDPDGCCLSGDEREKTLINEHDWFEIQELVQKVTLLKQGLVSRAFAQQINQAIQSQTDNEETAKLLKDLA